MKIEFFVSDEGLDPRATEGGVYIIELLKKGDESRKIPLYIGESECIVNRCGRHLGKVYGEPEYMGLNVKNILDDSLIIRFSVLESVKTKKIFWGFREYKEAELRYIKKYHPLTQLNTSDRQVSNKVDVVQKKMSEVILGI